MSFRGRSCYFLNKIRLYDSITHNARLNTKNYEWPNPPICDPDERAIDAPEAAIAAHQKQLVRSVRAGDAAPQQPSGVLLGKRVLLGGDHGYNTMSPRYCAVKTLVERAGGVVESNDDGRGMHKADILITRFRAGEEYIIVSLDSQSASLVLPQLRCPCLYPPPLHLGETPQQDDRDDLLASVYHR